MKIYFKFHLELNFEQKKDQELLGKVCRHLPNELDLALKVAFMLASIHYEYSPFRVILILLHSLM